MLVIGRGGDGCARVDYGIGITEQDTAKFGGGLSIIIWLIAQTIINF